MEIEGGDITSVTVLIIRKRVNCVWIAVGQWLWGLESSIWEERGIEWHRLCEIRWTSGLPVMSAGYRARRPRQTPGWSDSDRKNLTIKIPKQDAAIRASFRGVNAQDPILDKETLEDGRSLGVDGIAYFSGNWNMMSVRVSGILVSQLSMLYERCGSSVSAVDGVEVNEWASKDCPAGWRIQLDVRFGNLSGVRSETWRRGVESFDAGMKLSHGSG